MYITTLTGFSFFSAVTQLHAVVRVAMKGPKATEAFYQSPQKHRDESMKANRRKLELEELNSGNIECEWL